MREVEILSPVQLSVKLLEHLILMYEKFILQDPKQQRDDIDSRRFGFAKQAFLEDKLNLMSMSPDFIDIEIISSCLKKVDMHKLQGNEFVAFCINIFHAMVCDTKPRLIYTGFSPS